MVSNTNGINWNKVDVQTDSAYKNLMQALVNQRDSFDTFGKNINAGLERLSMRYDDIDRANKTAGTQMIINRLNNIRTPEEYNKFVNEGGLDLVNYMREFGRDFDPIAANRALGDSAYNLNARLANIDSLKPYSEQGREAVNAINSAMISGNPELIRDTFAKYGNNLPLVQQGNAYSAGNAAINYAQNRQTLEDAQKIALWKANQAENEINSYGIDKVTSTLNTLTQRQNFADIGTLIEAVKNNDKVALNALSQIGPQFVSAVNNFGSNALPANVVELANLYSMPRTGNFTTEPKQEGSVNNGTPLINTENYQRNGNVNNNINLVNDRINQAQQQDQQDDLTRIKNAIALASSQQSTGGSNNPEITTFTDSIVNAINSGDSSQINKILTEGNKSQNAHIRTLASGLLNLSPTERSSRISNVVNFNKSFNQTLATAFNRQLPPEIKKALGTGNYLDLYSALNVAPTDSDMRIGEYIKNNKYDKSKAINMMKNEWLKDSDYKMWAGSNAKEIIEATHELYEKSGFNPRVLSSVRTLIDEVRQQTEDGALARWGSNETVVKNFTSALQHLAEVADKGTFDKLLASHAEVSNLTIPTGITFNALSQGYYPQSLTQTVSEKELDNRTIYNKATKAYNQYMKRNIQNVRATGGMYDPSLIENDPVQTSLTKTELAALEKSKDPEDRQLAKTLLGLADNGYITLQ